MTAAAAAAAAARGTSISCCVSADHTEYKFTLLTNGAAGASEYG